MKKYTVKVCRTGYGFAEIEVKAQSHIEAEEIANECAGDYLYNEKSADYEVQEIILKKD